MTRWNVRLDSAVPSAPPPAASTAPLPQLAPPRPSLPGQPSPGSSALLLLEWTLERQPDPPPRPHPQTAGVVPAFITYPPERLDWSTRQKEFGATSASPERHAAAPLRPGALTRRAAAPRPRAGAVLFGKGQHARAGRRYKKALLDLEAISTRRSGRRGCSCRRAARPHL